MRGCLLAWGALGCVLGCGASDEVDPGFTALAGGGGASSSTGAGSNTTGASSSSGVEPQLLGAPYPIVLCHGFFGFEEFAGLDWATYYYEIKAHLAAEGETLVFTPAVDPFNSSAYRGQQLIGEVEAILAQTGHGKVNLIGHSQGGLDVRVVAHERPDLVASVVTIATPHHGTPIADIALGLMDDPNADDVLDLLVDAVGAPLYDEVGSETDVQKPLHDFSQPGISAFNAEYEDVPGVWYASIAGRSDFHGGGSACHGKSPQFMLDWDGELDPVDPLFGVSEAILDGGFGNPYPNDGLIRVNDARWGDFLGCIPADHLDQVGHLFGDGPGFGNDWSYRSFFADLVGLLRERGL